MAKSSNPEKVSLTKVQVEQLQSRLKERDLTEEDALLLSSVLELNFWLQEELANKNLSIKRLQKLFGFKQEKKPTPDLDDANTSNQDSKDDLNETDGGTNPEVNGATNKNNGDLIAGSQWDENKNHGRFGADDYEGLPIDIINHSDELLANGSCPDCADCNSSGKLYPVPPSVVVLLESQSLISGTRYQLERSRCRLCQKYFTAELPAGSQNQSKYSYSCYTQIAIWHYYAGVPFKRLEMLQAAQGVPLSDSTQYDLMVSMYKSVVEPVVGALRQVAANSSMIFIDDTPGRIVEQTIANKQATNKKDKSSIHATALLTEIDGHRVCLFDTSTEPAGKSMKKLLKQRKNSDDFITMSDASQVNFTELEDALMAKWIISLCLVHSRRKFHELLTEHDQDIQLVLDIMSKVYQNERHCKQDKLNDIARLEYHQKHSEPVMAALFTWLNNLLLHKEVEPNSRFGGAIFYLLKRWEQFTEFLRTPGIPLDNNPCEQTIKILIRYRNNSKTYRTFFGATIGDAFMSLIHTAVLAGINIFDYLNCLQMYEANVNSQPERWLPWLYQQTMTELATSEPPPE